MAGEIASAFVRIRANTTGFRQETEAGVKGGLSGIGKIVGGAFAVAGIGEAVKHVVAAAARQEEELASVRQAIRSTNSAWEVHGKTVFDTLREIALQSGFTVAELSQGFNRVQFGVRDSAESLSVLNVAMDISRASHRSLAQVVVAVSRAVQGSVGGLGRYGIVLDKTKFSTDKVIAGQQVLAELQRRFAGQSETYAKTAAGAQARFTESLNELEVSLGQTLLPFFVKVTDGLNHFLGSLRQSGSVLKPFGLVLKAITTPIGEVFSLLGKNKTVAEFFTGAVIGMTVALVAWKTATLAAAAAQAVFDAALAANPIGITVVAIAALVGGLAELYGRNKAFRDAVNQTWTDIRGIIGGVVREVRAFWAAWGADLTGITRRVFDFIKTYIENTLRVVQGVFQVVGGLLRGDWGQVWDGLKNITAGGLGNIVLVMRAYTTVIGGAARAIGQSIWDGLIVDGLGRLEARFADVFAGLGRRLAGFAVDFYHYGLDIGKQLAQGIYDGLPTTKLGNLLGGAIFDAVQYARDHVGSTVEEVGARLLGGPIIDGVAAGINAAGGGLGNRIGAQVSAALNHAGAGLTTQGGVLGRTVGQTLVDSLQTELVNIDFSPVAKQIAAIQASLAAEQIASQQASLQTALQKAQSDLQAALFKPLPGDTAGFAAALAQRQQLETAVQAARQQLSDFQNQERSTQLQGILDTQKTAIQARIQAEQAAQTLADAVASANSTIVNSMLQAEQNLNSIASQFAGTLGSVLDARLQATLTALGHSPLARQISAIDAQLRGEQERDARDSARRGLADARRNLVQQVQSVKDAQAALQKILSEGPQGGQSVRSQAFQQVVKPGQPVTGGETPEQYQARVRAAEQAVTQAQQQESSARQQIKDQERQLQELLLQQRRDALARRLQAEKTHLQAVEAAHKASAERRVSDLTEEFNRGLIGVKQFNAEIAKVLRGEGVTYRAIGHLLGIAVADQFWAELKALGFQASAIAAGPDISRRGFSGRELNIVRPIDNVRQAVRDVASAQKARDDAALAEARAQTAEQAKTRAATEQTAKATTALARGKHPPGWDPKWDDPNYYAQHSRR